MSPRNVGRRYRRAKLCCPHRCVPEYRHGLWHIFQQARQSESDELQIALQTNNPMETLLRNIQKPISIDDMFS